LPDCVGDGRRPQDPSDAAEKSNQKQNMKAVIFVGQKQNMKTVIFVGQLTSGGIK
jgi:hypothetical protein